jgi:hypothetical protein
MSNFRRRIDMARQQLGLPPQRGLLDPYQGRVRMPRGGQIAPPQSQHIAPPAAQRVAMPAAQQIAPPQAQQIAPPQAQNIAPPAVRQMPAPAPISIAPPQEVVAQTQQETSNTLAGRIAQQVQQGGEKGLVGWFKRISSDDEKMGKLLLALNSMRQNPDQNLAAMAKEQIKSARERKKTKQVTSETVKWLAKQGRKDLASLVAKNPAMSGEAIKVALKGSQGQLTEAQMKEAGGLRDDLRTDLKDFELAQQGWQGIKTFYQNPGAVSDYALAVGFAKILDPGSVVREGEVAAVAKSGQIGEALKSQLKNAFTGEGALPQEIRDEIAQLSRQLYADRATTAKTTLERYTAYAGKSGLGQEDIYMGAPIKMPEPLKKMKLNEKLTEIEKEKRKRGLING